MHILLPILFFINNLVSFIKSDCEMYQECPDPKDEKCRPRKRVGEERKTFQMTKNLTLAQLCPDYKPGEQVCCTDIQLTALQNNFFTIDQIFGTAGQGCDLCAINLKKFWCAFTCDPRQSEFLFITGVSNHTVGKDDVRALADLDLHVEDNTMCEIFRSCKKAKFTTQVPAMGNSLGFLNFQGVNAYQKIAVFIYFKQSDFGIKFYAYPCDTLPDEKGYIGGYKIEQNCTCSTCNSYCDYSLVNSTPVFEGLSGKIVGIVYAVAIALTGILVYLRIKLRGSIDALEDFEDIKEEKDDNNNNVLANSDA